jgi:phage gpG-like protein
MFKKKTTKRGNLRISGGMADFIDAAEMLADGISDREFQRYIADIIAHYAVKLAKENVWEGGNPNTQHAEDTPEITEKLSNGARETGSELMETGKLYESIKVASSTVSMGKVHVEVGVIDDAIAEYALIHEYGGNPGGAIHGKNPNVGYIPARPFLTPAVREAAYSALENPILQNAINKALDAMAEGKDWRVHLRGVRL